MPLFGSGAGTSAPGACAKSDEESTTGARPKEDAGRSAISDGVSPQKNDGSSRETSPRRDPPDDRRRRDRYALLFGVQQVNVEAGPNIMPPYAWNETVIKDILGSEIRGISDVIVINPGECLIFTGQRSKGHGFTQAEAVALAQELHNSYTLWIGRRVQIRCVPRTLKDAKADLRAAKEYLRQSTYRRLAQSPTRRPGEPRDTSRQQTSPWDTDRGRGMVRRSDRYQAQQYLRNQPGGTPKPSAWSDADGTSGPATWQFHHAQEPEGRAGLGSGAGRDRPGRGHPLGRGRPDEVPWAFRDQFHPNLSGYRSAQEEQSDSPPEYTLDESGDESDDVVGYDFTNGHYTTVADRDRRERRDQRLAYRRRRRERRRGFNGRPKKLNLPIFRDSSSDNAITYDDWRSEVDNFVREGHSSNLIRDSVLSALEGRPRHTAKAAMEDGDGTLKSVMSALDQVYGGATTYTTLLNKLNSVQQGYDETAKDYYERVLQIRVKLQEFHAYMFRRGDLERQTKEAFFNGLRAEYQAMVVHKRDDPTVGTTDLLSAVRECEENQENNRRNRRADYAKAYPPSQSRPVYRDNRNGRPPPPPAPAPVPPVNQNRYRHDNRHTDRNVPIHAAQVDATYDYNYQGDDYVHDYVNYDLPLDQGDEELTFATEMCNIAIEKADIIERQSGKCFNCREPGHYWRDCPKPLKEEFQRLQDHPKKRQEELNGKGGPGKGGRVPQSANVKQQAPAQAAAAPTPQ